MQKQYVIVPEDGATNIKLDVFCLEDFSLVTRFITNTPINVIDGWHYNATEAEFIWFDEIITKLPQPIKKQVAVISVVARGASGGFVDKNNRLLDSKDHQHTLAYTHPYPEVVEQQFKKIAQSDAQYYQETGSILHFPGGLSLIKRFLFESMVRSEILKQAQGFATYNILMSGHFLDDDYLSAIKKAGNEHTYWMCHTGARNINAKPGTPSKISGKIPRFADLIPANPSMCYQILGNIGVSKAKSLGLPATTKIAVGGHDTALSHIPVTASFNQYFARKQNQPLIHIDVGTWTMCAQIGEFSPLLKDGYKRGIMVQGTVDGEPVVTGIYGGGRDFQYIKAQVEAKGKKFLSEFDAALLEKIVTEKNSFVLPNVNPDNYATGPFPELKGKIINEDKFFNAAYGTQHIVICLTVAFAAAYQINLVAKNQSIPIVLTAGGSRDPYLGKLLHAITGREVYLMRNSKGDIFSETTTLGAAIVGKAALLNMHPYAVDLSTAHIQYERIESLPNKLIAKITDYIDELKAICGVA